MRRALQETSGLVLLLLIATGWPWDTPAWCRWVAGVLIVVGDAATQRLVYWQRRHIAELQKLRKYAS